jgi:hypothetical protein
VPKHVGDLPKYDVYILVHAVLGMYVIDCYKVRGTYNVKMIKDVLISPSYYLLVCSSDLKMS